MRVFPDGEGTAKNGHPEIETFSILHLGAEGVIFQMTPGQYSHLLHLSEFCILRLHRFCAIDGTARFFPSIHLLLKHVSQRTLRSDSRMVVSAD